MLERVVVGFLALACGVTVFARSLDPNAFNFDVGWLLYVAEQMFEGQALYRDVIDENPPMVFWLSVVAVSIARALGAAPIWVFNSSVLLLVGLVGALSHRILRLGWPESNPSYRLAVVACFGVVAVLSPGFDYGQRENLFFIFLAPYIFAAASAARGERSTGWTAVAVGGLAGASRHPLARCFRDAKNRIQQAE